MSFYISGKIFKHLYMIKKLENTFKKIYQKLHFLIKIPFTFQS